jgi:dolichol-phosphate mannosyltransferase
MAGFFAIKKVTFDQATDIRPLGYKIGLELIVRFGCRNVVEIPIAFRDRTVGESKLTTSQQLLYLQHLGRLYSAKYAGPSRFARFGLVGLSGMVVDLGALTLLSLATPFWLARALAIWVAMTWNFALNRRYTFAASAEDSTLRQYVEFSGACLLGGAVNWLVSMSVAPVVPMLPGRLLIASAIGVAAGCLVNFFICDRAVFRQPAAGDVLPMAREQEAATPAPPSHRPAYSGDTQRKRSA